MPIFRRWCRRYAAGFTAVGAVITPWVGVMLPILLLLEPPLHYGEGKRCSKFRRGCRRYAAHFTAVGVGVALPKMF